MYSSCLDILILRLAGMSIQTGPKTKCSLSVPQTQFNSILKCMIKIFRGGGRGSGVVDGVGGSSERCLKWGGGGWGVIKGSFQKHLKTGGG